jgi:hypothetical protein
VGGCSNRCSNHTARQRPSEAPVDPWPAPATVRDHRATSSHRGGRDVDRASLHQSGEPPHRSAGKAGPVIRSAAWREEDLRESTYATSQGGSAGGMQLDLVGDQPTYQALPSLIVIIRLGAILELLRLLGSRRAIGRKIRDVRLHRPRHELAILCFHGKAAGHCRRADWWVRERTKRPGCCLSPPQQHVPDELGESLTFGSSLGLQRRLFIRGEPHRDHRCPVVLLPRAGGHHTHLPCRDSTCHFVPL